MELEETCKYMDTEEREVIDNSQMKGKLGRNFTVGAGRFSRES